MFKKITTTVDWNAITDDATILTLTESGVDQTKTNNLDVTDVIGFITASGKHGLIKVDEMTAGADGSITISVKVQQ